MASRKVKPTSTAKATAETASARGSVVDTVRALAEVLDQHSLTEIVVETGGAAITLRRGGTSYATAPAPMMMPAYAPAPASSATAPAASPAATVVDDHAHIVTSPFVGTFYRRPSPDKPTYVAVNDRVEKGKALCIIEAMKLMNEIEADVSGTIIGVLAEDGSPVEYGQPLFKIAPG